MKKKYRVTYGGCAGYREFSNWKETAAYAKYALLAGYSVQVSLVKS